MNVQSEYAGYLQETPEFAEGPESYVGEYPYYPGQYSPSPQGGYPSPVSYPQGMSYGQGYGMSAQPSWWRWPTIHWSWTNQFRPWRQPPFLSLLRLQQPFDQSGWARMIALSRWRQQQGGMPGVPYSSGMPGMPGMPYSSGMPGMPGVPGLPPAPGMPGFPGQPFPGAAVGGRGRRRRRRRR